MSSDETDVMPAEGVDIMQRLSADDLPVIRVSGVSKRYRIWNRPVSRLRAFALERVASMSGARLAQRLRERASNEYRDFEALSAVSFQIRAGESVAIIGRNGSGKSTLLQIIAGTLKPTAGDAEVRGRVAALLELGSAFHPEFTGRDNVYLYCAVLGIPRMRVEELFDGIAAFADIGDFMDQPFKVYSSGMKLRLAFSVQTAIDPDILIVDEALAVGDMFFQAKCMRRIRQLMENGTTILFVSHSMSVVRDLCDRAILLEEGRLILDDEVARATQRYLALQIGDSSDRLAETYENETLPLKQVLDTDIADVDELSLENSVDPYFAAEIFERKAAPERIQDGRALFRNVQMLNGLGQLVDLYEFADATTLRMTIEICAPVDNLWVGYHIRTKTGVDAVHIDSSLCGELGKKFHQGATYVLDWRFSMRMQHGDYYIMCVLAIPHSPHVSQTEWDYIDVVNHATDFSVAPRRSGMIGGLVAPINKLNIIQLGDIGE